MIVNSPLRPGQKRQLRHSATSGSWGNSTQRQRESSDRTLGAWIVCSTIARYPPAVRVPAHCFLGSMPGIAVKVPEPLRNATRYAAPDPSVVRAVVPPSRKTMSSDGHSYQECDRHPATSASCMHVLSLLMKRGLISGADGAGSYPDAPAAGLPASAEASAASDDVLAMSGAASAETLISGLVVFVVLELLWEWFCCDGGLDPGMPAATLKNSAQPGHLKLRELKRA